MVPQHVVQAVSREPAQPQPEKKYPFLTLPPSSGRGSRPGWVAGGTDSMSGVRKMEACSGHFEGLLYQSVYVQNLVKLLAEWFGVSLCLEFFICKIGVNTSQR